LALLAPQVLIADAPQAATLLLADKGERFRRHWTAPLLPTIWLSAVVGYAALRGRMLRTVGIGLLVAGTLTTFLLDSNLPGGGDYDPADVAWSERAEQHAYLVRRVPVGASVASSRRFLGNVADRAELYVFPPSYQGKLWPPERRAQVYLLDLTNDGTREALTRRDSPLRANRPYTFWLAGPDAMMLLDRPPEPGHVLNLDVGGMRLVGLDARYADKTVEIELHWQAASKPVQPLSRTLTVADSRGAVAAEASGTALDDLFPTTQWPAGQIVVDRVRLPTGDVFPDRARVGWAPAGDGPGESVEISLDLTR
jgi:hypothetical protein